MMGALWSCAGLDVGTGCLWVEIGAGQAIETEAPVKESALFHTNREGNACDYVLSYVVMSDEVLPEVNDGGEILQAVMAGEWGGSHGSGLNSDRRYLLVTLDWN
jgi:hypothetical protein